MQAQTLIQANSSVARPRLNVLAMAADAWGHVLYSRHQLLLRIGRDHDVLYSTGGRFIRELTWDCLKHDGIVGGFRRVGPVTIDVTPCFPFRNWRFAVLDRWAVSRLAERLQRRWEVSRGRPRILWLFHPSFRPYIDHLEYDRLVYHPHDRFSAMPGAGAELAEQERELCAIADVRIATSQVLADAMQHVSGASFAVLTNGVDYEACVSAAGGATPADLAAIPRPRIGYTGVMNQKVDFVLLYELAAARPDWHFVLVGKVDFLNEVRRREVEACAALPNVHFVGPRPQSAVPAYVAGLDVGLIPYRTGEAWSEAGNPLKLYEYMAVGIPAVCSSIGSIQSLGELVSCPGTAVDAWIAAIEAALADTSADLRTRRQAAARERDWNVLAAQALQIVSPVDGTPG